MSTMPNFLRELQLKEENYRDPEKYLQPTGELNNTPFYETVMDRANPNPQEDKFGEHSYIDPELLLIRLDNDIKQIRSCMTIREPTTLSMDKEQMEEEHILRDFGTYYLLLHNAEIYLEKNHEWRKSEKHPEGSSKLRMWGTYVGQEGLRIRELEEIAEKNGLEERVD